LHLFIIISLVPPSIVPFAYDDLVNIGDSIDLVCQVSKGDRPLQITWIFQGINDGDTYSHIKTKRITEKSSLLTIPNANSHHSGRYTCTAKNRGGSVSFTTRIIVNGIL
jgi:hypothetical protein